MTRVLYERDGRIARITLNRPDKLNAIDDELPGELEDTVKQADADPSRSRHGACRSRQGVLRRLRSHRLCRGART